MTVDFDVLSEFESGQTPRFFFTVSAVSGSMNTPINASSLVVNIFSGSSLMFSGTPTFYATGSYFIDYSIAYNSNRANWYIEVTGSIAGRSIVGRRIFTVVHSGT